MPSPRISRFLAIAVIPAIAISSAVTMAHATCSPSELYGPPADYTVGANPFSAVFADVNGDGKLDAIVNVNGTGQAAVMLGSGDGSLGAPVYFSILSGAFGPFKLTTGDFNGDGRLDLVAGNTGSNNFKCELLLGNGDGTFQPKTDVATGNGPGSLVARDFNGDGKLDLASADMLGNTISVMLGNGDGTFAAPVHYGAGSAPQEIVSGDFNGDGKPDLAAASSTGNDVYVYIAGANGTFNPPSVYPVGANPYSLATGDLDGDGKPELIVANAGASTATVLHNNGNGTFSTFAAFSTGTQPRSIAVGDFDQDGKLDVATANYDLTVTILPGAGTGALGSPIAYAVTGRATGIAVGDLNGDGFPDILATDYVDGQTHPLDKVSVLLNACGAPLPPPPAAPTLTGVRDVPHDQGGKVFVTWTRSNLDVGASYEIYGYRVWRRIPPLVASRMARNVFADALGSGRILATHAAGAQDVTYWERLVDLPAEHLAGYGYTAATTQDSIPDSNPYTAFFVTALDQNGAFYESNVDSGYSVDNLAPAPPAPVAGHYDAQGVHLHWGMNRESDLEGYRVYRGTYAGFTPSDANLLSAQRDTGYFDPQGDESSYYKIAARDLHGNPSSYVLVVSPSVASVPQVALAIDAVTPNPSRDGTLNIAFTLSGQAPAVLEILDLAGRRIVQRPLSGLGDGNHQFLLGRGAPLAGGVYLVRVTQGSRTVTAKAVVAR